MQELMLAWQDGLFLSKCIVITFATSPIWLGLLVYLHYRYTTKEEI